MLLTCSSGSCRGCLSVFAIYVVYLMQQGSSRGWCPECAQDAGVDAFIMFNAVHNVCYSCRALDATKMESW